MSQLFEQNWKGRKAIITGGCGFIGSNLADRLVNLGVQVTLVDSLVPEYGGNLFNISQIKDRVALNISDVRDKFSLRHLISGQEILFNLAGQTSHMDSMSDPQTDLDINCAAQLSILEVCREVNPNIRLVFASTRQIYGKPDYLPVDEKHPVRPVDVNGINKWLGSGITSFTTMFMTLALVSCDSLTLTGRGCASRMRGRHSLGFGLRKSSRESHLKSGRGASYAISLMWMIVLMLCCLLLKVMQREGKFSIWVALKRL
jgi:hypothetical protein